MERTVSIDGREVRFRASAAIPRMYRMRFRRDIIQDLSEIQKAVKASEQARNAGTPEEAPIPMEILTLFENVAFLMARHADPELPDSVDRWLEGYETFSIYAVFPVILELWADNLRTLSTTAKK